jgi:pimeloyl-ACP methyl ester carboxylesterase
VDDVRLYFDVEGCGLAVQGDAMAKKRALVLLQGGPGADHSFFKPEFSAMADANQVIYLDRRVSGRSDRGDPST